MNKKWVILIVVILVAGVTIFTTVKEDQHEATISLGSDDRELMKIAKDTYAFFEEYTDPNTGLTLDRVDLHNGEIRYEQTSPTNIAMYLLSLVAAVELEFEAVNEASEKAARVLQTLNEMEKWNGLYFNWYYTDSAELMNDWGKFISTVDNGWLTAALVVIGQYFPELQMQTEPLVVQMDYSALYDSAVGQFHGGYDVEAGHLTDHHYGMFYSETRITSYLAIGKEDVPERHWWSLYRTFLPEDTWQSQQPNGHYEVIDGHRLYQGHYEYEGIKYVPSWGGSMFEALMPAIIIDEKNLAPNGLGLNNKRHVQAQIAYAKNQQMDVWGFSPAAIENNYLEFGAPVLGAGEGYPDGGTVTSHASFLALEYAPEEVFHNIGVLKELGAYGEYGFYDTVQFPKGKVNEIYLSLDQGMILASIVNFLKDGVIRQHFHQDPIGSNGEHLLETEQFSIKEN
ncbi:glucoamylase family protein [Alkalihalobacillus sp. 1P02AB]|uniref:glucoamylase family protein n=1 Tax=Alkalihalobacillus sp. 1P02AB TaxID=3132260 RepID=UPI0039A687A2